MIDRSLNKGRPIIKKFLSNSTPYTNVLDIGAGKADDLLTARDIQKECQIKGLPWEKAKGFDGSAQISRNFIDKAKLELNDITFSLKKNGEQVQLGNSNDMLFSFDKIIVHISKFYTLQIGDLIYTGTPKGVGKVIEGDTLKGFITDKEMLKVVVK